jgi:hypothetical protein
MNVANHKDSLHAIPVIDSKFQYSSISSPRQIIKPREVLFP